MVYAAAVLATLLLLIAIVYVDVHRHILALRLRGLYGQEWLQHRCGLRTLQELELALDATLRPDGLFNVPRERVAALPVCWRTRGFAFLVPSLLAAVALLGFLLSCSSEPRYLLLFSGGGYVAFCFAYDVWVSFDFESQLGSHKDVARERRHDVLVEAIDAELEEDDYSLQAELQLVQHLLVTNRSFFQAEVAGAVANRANSPAIKLLYRLLGWGYGRFLLGKRKEIQDLKTELRELNEQLHRAGNRIRDRLMEHDGEYIDPLPGLRPPLPLTHVLERKIETLSERRLLSGADVDERLLRLRRIRGSL